MPSHVSETHSRRSRHQTRQRSLQMIVWTAHQDLISPHFSWMVETMPDQISPVDSWTFCQPSRKASRKVKNLMPSQRAMAVQYWRIVVWTFAHASEKSVLTSAMPSSNRP